NLINPLSHLTYKEKKMAQAPPPSPIMSHLREISAQVNEHVGMFIGYTTLAFVGLIVLLRLPSFFKQRIQFARLPSQGYFFKNKIIRSSTKNQNLKFTPTWTLKSKTLKTLGGFRIPFIGLNVTKFSFMLIYMIILVILSLYQNTNSNTSILNYKRFGFIAISQLPLTFILAMKNGPMSWLSGQGYEKLNFLHRFIGRMVFVFALVHGSLNLRLKQKLFNAIHITGPARPGLIALCALALIVFTGLRVFRNKFYQIFLICHIIGYLTAIVALWKHVDATHPYLAVCIAAICFDSICKLLKTRLKRATFTAMPAGLTRIEVAGVKDGWRAGQHVFIRVLKGRHIFEKHPFTIANAPNSTTPYGSTNNLLLVAKATGDFTKSIHRLAGLPRSVELSDPKSLEKSKPINQVPSDDPVIPSETYFHVILDGPYGAFFNDMTRYETVLLCAGGSGFTYCMATIEDIVGEAAIHNGRNICKHICLVWSLREWQMIQSFSSLLEETIRIAKAHGLDVTFKLFLTAGRDDPIDNLLPNTLVEFNATRPDFNQIVNQLIESKSGGGLGVGACGPIGLLDNVSDAVNNLEPSKINKIGGVDLHLEKFGW
ncbi:hypothetical protein O181_071352, partial [Austropuccinia psidii MF-1]|nr:hypothetical protein [Austropuccinia psidii MF-1]